MLHLYVALYVSLERGDAAMANLNHTHTQVAMNEQELMALGCFGAHSSPPQYAHFQLNCLRKNLHRILLITAIIHHMSRVTLAESAHC